MKLKELREQIDWLDGKILKLLNDRMEKAVMAKKLKAQIEDTGREQEILERISKNATGLIDSQFSIDLYKQIIAESKRLQSQNRQLIGFQGEHGAHSERAAYAWQEDIVAIPCHEFSEILEGIENDLFDYGIVPVENTLGGIVGAVNSLLIYTDLNVIGAIDMPISHCLMTLPGVDHRDIKYVYSHPQALSQCRHFLERNKLEPMPFYDTAGAAVMLTEEKRKDAAALANKLAAELYSLEIVKEDAQDSNNNRTRFLILSKEKNVQGGNKCSIIFTTEHKSGTLFKVLELFAKNEINLTRIESVPNNADDYAFFVDFLGSDLDKKVQDILAEIKNITGNLKMLGCYTERIV